MALRNTQSDQAVARIERIIVNDVYHGNDWAVLYQFDVYA